MNRPSLNCLYLLLVQVLPLDFTVQAVVTPSELVFSSLLVNFGSSTVHESVVATLSVTNTACLSQDFGFVNLPKVCMYMQVSLL